VFALSAVRFGPTPELAPALLFLLALIAVTAIDLEHQLIPDLITLPGIAAGFLSSLIVSRPGWKESLAGIALGGGILLIVILLSGGGMGGGDMKLAAMMGAFLGWKLVLVAMFIGILLGGLVAVTLLASGRRGRKDPVPFGPFLATGSAASLFWGEGILRWYLGGFQ
jgi:leader peptidase (prepilin peptidase)/N-methyltransferase